LTTVNIGSGVTAIGRHAFTNSFLLSAFNVASGNFTFSSVDGVLFNKYKKKLILFPCGKESDLYFVPESVTTIGTYAFENCYGLKNIRFFPALTVIEDYAFKGCIHLPKEDGLRYADTYLVETASNSTAYTIKDGTKWIGNDAFRNLTSLASVYIPNSVTTICDNAFYNCQSLTRLMIPDGVTSIGPSAFYNVPEIVYCGTATGGPWKALSWLGQTKEVYTVFDRSTESPTLTYYYDNQRATRIGLTEMYDPEVLRWNGYNTAIQKVVIDPSMKDALLTSMRRLFFGGMDSDAGIYNTLYNVTAIEGLENLNTANVTNMSEMFFGCYNLKSIDLSSFNTANATNMDFMFYYCGSLESLDLNSFDIGKLKSAYCMFWHCESLQTIYCNADWSRSAELTSSTDMFAGCTSLVGGNGTPYYIDDVDHTFARPDGGRQSPGYFTSRDTQMYTVFDGDHTLTYYYGDKYELTNPYCELYDPINMPGKERFNNYNEMITEAVIDPSMANANLTSMYSFFNGGRNNLPKLATIKGLENLNTANVEDMSKMFFRCFALKTIDLTMLDTKKLTNATEMFTGCGNLTTIYCNEDWTSQLVKSEYMFTSCVELIGGTWPITVFDRTKTDGTYARPCDETASGYFTRPKIQMYTEFDEATGTLTYYFDDKRMRHYGVTELCDASSRFVDYSDKVVKAVIDPSMKNATVTNLSNLFYGGYSSDKDDYITLSKMTAIEGLENLNTAIATDMNGMFNGCSALTSIDLSSFNTEYVVNMGSMFQNCSSLKVIDLTSFSINSLEHAYSVFFGCKSLTTIFCDKDWSKSTKLVGTGYMFDYCDQLVGGKGTAFEHSESYKNYARPDGGPDAPGYFTKKDAMVYTVFDEATGTLTYRYDDQFNVSNPYVEFYDPVNHPAAERFAGYYKKVLKAGIDPSMKDANLTSLNSMFYGCAGSTGIYALSNMKSIEGLEYLNTANVTDMSNMFLGCNAIETLDVSTFDVSKVTDMTFMFNSCYALMTIFCNEDWSVSPALTEDLGMFTGSKLIVGGQGTDYNSSKVDRSYARPDGGTEAPGYFTATALIKGDANDDGQVTAADIVAITNYMTGNPPADFSKANADINLDGVINIADIVAVANILLNN
jgi:surface protein